MKRVYEPAQNSAWLKNLLISCYGIWDHHKMIHYEDKIYKIRPPSTMRWVFEQQCSGSKLALRNILLDHLQSMEKEAPGSSPLLVKFLYNDVKKISYSKATSEASLNLSSQFLHGEELKIFQALKSILSSTARINLKIGNYNRNTIKVINANKFPIGLDPVFFKSVGSKSLYLNDAKIIIIEGAPQSIGELDRLLTKSHELKWNVLLIARSFPEEVSSTLAANWIKGSLSVLPVVYGNSVENINTSIDIASITSALPISSNLGDVLSLSVVDSEKHGFSPHLSVDDWETIITSNITDNYHLRSLCSRLESSTDHNEQEILSQRISSLSSEVIEINLKNENPIIFENLDNALKTFQEYTRSGILNTNIGKIPYSHFNTALKHSKAFKDKIESIGGFLLCPE